MQHSSNSLHQPVGFSILLNVLAEKPYEYSHSSARFYDGDKSGYKVKDYLDVLAELKYKDEMNMPVILLPGVLHRHFFNANN